MPARTSSRKTGSVLEAGPRVATIFARRCDGESVKLNSNAIGGGSKKSRRMWVKRTVVRGQLHCTRAAGSIPILIHLPPGYRESLVRLVTDRKSGNGLAGDGNPGLAFPKERAIQLRTEQ